MSSGLPQAMSKGGKRRLRNLVVNRSIQMPFVSTVVLTTLSICAGFGYLIWRQSRTAQEILLRDAEELGPEFVAQISTDNWHIWVVAVVAAIGISIIIGGYLIIMTHRVAGPLYKMTRYFDQMAYGRFPRPTALRRRDMLRGFYAEFQTKYQQSYERISEKLESLEELVEQLDGMALSEEQAAAVDTAQGFCAITSERLTTPQ